MVERRHDKIAVLGRARGNQLSHVIFRVRYKKIGGDSGYLPQHVTPSPANDCVILVNALEIFGRRNVVILDDLVTSERRSQVESQVPPDGKVVDKNIVGAQVFLYLIDRPRGDFGNEV